MNFDDAYANASHIINAETYPPRWSSRAQKFRDALDEDGRLQGNIRYGDGERNLFDLFLPPRTEATGLVMFVHGGYWKAFDKSYWSHLAAGSIAHGYAVAMPSYTLCPDARISTITNEIGTAVMAAAEHIDGPIRLMGHSAGGHLVTRMISASSPLTPALKARIVNTVSISGVHDLRPLIYTQMNDILQLDLDEARRESPQLLEPMTRARLVCWAGADERPEFVRQNAALASVWHGLGAQTVAHTESRQHHFNVIDALTDGASPLVNALIEPTGSAG